LAETGTVALSGADEDELRRQGIDASRLRELAGRLLHRGPEVNQVRGRVEAPAPGDLVDLPARDSAEGRRLVELGLESMRRGELALVVLAGGMATRMGGVVKALVEALPDVSFLDARLAERAHWADRSGARLPMWLMTSDATDGPIREALAAAGDRARDVATFVQGRSARLTPEGELFRGADGLPSTHATGHGDLPDALRASGLLDRFVDEGGRVLWLANLDNLGAAIDPLLLGWHLDHGAPLTVEVVDKTGDTGGIPVRLDGRPVILEDFRVPDAFDAASVQVFNTNTFLVDATALREVEIEWSWFRVQKTVDGRPAIQFERLVGQLPEVLDARFVHVPRSGPESRFIPAKDFPELERNRQAIAQRVSPFLR
jgi:UTP--glucose-1-phosphate uridylyltransferase